MSAFRDTARVIEAARKVGFQWFDWRGPLKKVKEELRELDHEIQKRSPSKKRISEELGDLLFSVCNLATLLGLDAEAALRATLKRFRSRFRFVEDELKKKGKSPKGSSHKEMLALWRKAKKRYISPS